MAQFTDTYMPRAAPVSKDGVWRIWLYFAEIPGAWCSMGYPSEVRPKSREISFTHNLCLSYPMVSKFSTEHDSITAVLLCKRSKPLDNF